jgi:effector-binding domain-containing protein
MPGQCEAIDFSVQPTVSIRRTAKAVEMRNVIGEAFTQVDAHLRAIGVDESDRSHGFSAYHDLDLREPDMENLKAEVGFLVSRPADGSGEIQPHEIPAGRYARIEHLGPLNEIGSAYTTLIDWLTKNGYRTRGTVFEIYLHDTFEEEIHDDDFHARILFPLRPA